MKPLLSLLLGTLALLYICDVKHEHQKKAYYVNDMVYSMQMYCTTTETWIINGEHYE